jgi:glycogen phosphorylase
MNYVTKGRDNSTTPPDERSAIDVDTLRSRILTRLTYDVGGRPDRASPRDWFFAAALVARDEVIDRWRESNERAGRPDSKQVCYLSLEFLIGRLLSDVIGNLGITETMRSALACFDVDLDMVCAEEPDAALGNGGLGRLAACFMESMASVGIASYGYGIRYEYGLFRQTIDGGCQNEVPEPWLTFANPWEIERSNVVYDIGFGGAVDSASGPAGDARYTWYPHEVVRALAYDTPVVGWQGKQINTLRLWSARSVDPLRLSDFNRGDHVGAVSDRGRAEAISRVLYPGDESVEGQTLRLRQEYFFASASLQDILQRHLRVHGKLSTLASRTAIQLNDTHPAIGIPELMRLLMDVHGFAWAEAWKISSSTFSYTNHTLLPEALERWPVWLLEGLLPRHMQIIYEINAHHLTLVEKHTGADERLLASASLIDESHVRRVRMGNLAFVGSHKINGVSALHSDLVRQSLFADLDAVYPGRVVNKTNGITFRRWLHRANPPLTALLTDVLGKRLLSDPTCLNELAQHADDPAFQSRVKQQRRLAKQRLAVKIRTLTGVTVDPEALFDVHIKRIHEYKRQLLNILQTVALYHEIRAHPDQVRVPTVKIFAGKAAASYHTAKLIIRLVCDVASVVNNDPIVENQLKVVFLPDYNVTLAESIVPAADLSEQISTAGMEASGTGNMKLMLNGALTIGTLDGANVEIRDYAGADNIFIFGLTTEEVGRLKSTVSPRPEWIGQSPELADALDAIGSGVFSPGQNDRYRDLVHGLRQNDSFMVTADFDSYKAAQKVVAATWADPARWWHMSIMNLAGAAWFSSDRTVKEYAKEIWAVTPQ